MRSAILAGRAHRLADAETGGRPWSPYGSHGLSRVRPIHALTSLRGVAAWWVVLYHFREFFPAGTPWAVQAFTAKGYLAVDLFFELSGFVIALNYASRMETFRLGDSIRFLLLRLARIYPLHLFMMVVFLANPIALKFFSTLGTVDHRYDPGYYVMSLFLVQNWGFADDLKWNIPAWSISTEWFSYLVFPLLTPLLVPAYRRRLLVVGGAILLLVLLAVLTAGNGGELGGEIPRLGLMRCLIEFQTGVLLCHFTILCPASGRGRSGIAACLALALFAAYALLPVPDYAVMPTGFLCLIYALTDENNPLARWLRVPVLERLGDISYSTYLVHYFVKDWVKFLVVGPATPALAILGTYVIVTVALSAVLYRLVERPGQQAVQALLRRRALPDPGASAQPGPR